MMHVPSITPRSLFSTSAVLRPTHQCTRRLQALLALSLLFTACRSPTHPVPAITEASPPNKFMPTGTGTWWIYDVVTNDNRSFAADRRIQKFDTIDGIGAWHAVGLLGGGIWEHWISSTDGVWFAFEDYRFPDPNDPDKHSRHLLPLMIMGPNGEPRSEKGHGHWANHAKYKVTTEPLGKETLTIGNKTYECVHVRVTQTTDYSKPTHPPTKFNGMKTHTREFWFAPSVGPVQHLSLTGTTEQVYRLRDHQVAATLGTDANPSAKGGSANRQNVALRREMQGLPAIDTIKLLDPVNNIYTDILPPLTQPRPTFAIEADGWKRIVDPLSVSREVAVFPIISDAEVLVAVNEYEAAHRLSAANWFNKEGLVNLLVRDLNAHRDGPGYQVLPLTWRAHPSAGWHLTHQQADVWRAERPDRFAESSPDLELSAILKEVRQESQVKEIQFTTNSGTTIQRLARACLAITTASKNGILCVIGPWSRQDP